MYTDYSQGDQQFHPEPMTQDHHSPFFGQAGGGDPMSQMSQMDLMTNQQPFGQHHHHYHHPEKYQQSHYPVSAASVREPFGHATAHGSFRQVAATNNTHQQHQPHHPFVTQLTQPTAMAHQPQYHTQQEDALSSWENTQEFEDAFF
jgi:hypothetical protein